MLWLGVFSLAHATSPAELLASALTAHVKTPLSAMQRVRVLQHGTLVEYRVLVEQDGKGSARYEVLAPLRHKGMVLVEDANRQTRFDPSTNRCEVQPSARSAAQQVVERRRPALIKSNYRLAVSGQSTVGGRRATVITAKPLAEGALNRTYWLDAERNIILRMRITGEDGELLYDRELMFPRFDVKLRPETFAARFGCGVDVTQRPAPKFFTSLSALSRDVGFDILTPQELPVGLSFLYAESMETPSGKTAVLRYSDGLAQASVYQVKSSVLVPTTNAFAGADRAAVFSRHGSKYTIVGDLGESGMSRLVAGFERADKARQHRWAAELAKQLRAPEAEVHRLLDAGMDLNDAAFLLVVRAESRAQLGSLKQWWLAGLTRQEIVDRSRADWSAVQKRIRTVSLSR
jgi:negative regulator of sigma E activity